MKHLREIYDYRQMIFSLVRKELREGIRAQHWDFCGLLLIPYCSYVFIHLCFLSLCRII